MTLWHFTCDHGRAQIVDVLRSGSDLVDPANPRAEFASPFVWLTDLALPNRSALGLTMHHISCDRTVHRYRVTDESTCVRWLAARRVLPRGYVDGLELAPDARPAHWWISAAPVPVVYDPVVQAVAL